MKIIKFIDKDGKEHELAFTLGAALEKLGIWTQIQEKLNQRKNFYAWMVSEGYINNVEERFPTEKAIIQSDLIFKRKWHDCRYVWFVDKVKELVEEYEVTASQSLIK